MRRSHYVQHYQKSPAASLEAALDFLRIARDLAREAGAPRATAAVRRALKSVGGALRYAQTSPRRRAKEPPPEV